MYLGKPKCSPYQEGMDRTYRTWILIVQLKSQGESHIHNTDTKELTPSLLITHAILAALLSLPITKHQGRESSLG